MFIWAYNVGVDIIESENDCNVNVCSGYDAFYFDEYNSMCYCYKGNEIVYQEYLI